MFYIFLQMEGKTKPLWMVLNEKKCWRNRQVKEWKIVIFTIICKKKVGFWCLFAKKICKFAVDKQGLYEIGESYSILIS